MCPILTSLYRGRRAARTATAVLLSSVMLAGVAQAEPAKVGLEECIKLGIEHSPSLHSVLMQVEEAKGKLSEVNAARLPGLSVSGNYTRLSEIDPFIVTLPGMSQGLPLSPNIPNTYGAKLTLTQPLFTGLRLEKTASALGRNVQAAKLDYATAVRDLTFEITQAYWNLVKACDYSAIMDEDVRRQEAHRTDVQNLFDQGLASRNDVLRVEVQHSNSLLQQITAHNNVALARVYLENVVGRPLEGDIDPTIPEVTVTLSDSLPGLRDTALTRRTEMLAMRQRVEMGKAGVGVARSGWLPQIALVADYNYLRPNQRIQPITDEFKDTWDVGVYLTYDLWNWGQARHRTRQAQAQLSQARDAQRRLEDGITLQVSQDFLKLRESTERINVARAALAQADEGYRITHDLYREGMVQTSDLLDASVMQIQARVGYSAALIDCHIAQARLEKTLGR